MMNKKLIRIEFVLGLLLFCSTLAYSAENIRDAASKGDLAEVKAAIARGEDKDSKSSEPSFTFGSSGFDKNGAMSYQKDAEWTPLIHAAFKKHTNVVQYLLEIGANPNIVDYSGITAIMYSIAESDTNTIEIFANYDKSLIFKEPRFGMTPLMWAMVRGNTDIGKILSSKTADINIQDNDGWTALHYAANRGRIDCMENLLARKPNINLCDKDGKTPLMVASENGEEKIVQILLENDATVSVLSKENKTALDYAEGRLGLKGLKIEKIDQDSVRIAEGFVYQRNMELPSGQMIRIKDIVGGVVMPSEGSAVAMGAESAVGTIWVFDKPGIVLHNGDYIYTSKVKDASIAFTKEGAVLKGFSIENPNEEGIKKVIAILQKGEKASRK